MKAKQPMIPTDFHVLLVLSQGSLYGHAAPVGQLQPLASSSS
jgi:hypothetical protein